MARLAVAALLLIVPALLAVSACGATRPAQSASPPTSIVDTWRFDCGRGQSAFALTIAADRTASLDWISFADGGTQTERYALRLSVPGDSVTTTDSVTATVVQTDADAAMVGATLRLTMIDADTLRLADAAKGLGLGIGEIPLNRAGSGRTPACGDE